MHPTQEHLHICETNTNRIKRGNRMQCIHPSRCQHSTHSKRTDQPDRKYIRRQSLNNVLEQLDLTDIYRKLHPKATEYIFFSSAHGTFSRIDHTLGHWKNLSKFKKIEIIPTSFSDHKGIKLEINYTKKTKESKNTWRLDNMLLNNHGSKTK